jgi:hypothetical protein
MLDMPNIDPVKGEIIVTNGEIVGQPTTKKTGFFGKMGSIFGGIAKVGIGMATGGGIGAIIPNLINNGGSLIGQLEQVHQSAMRQQAQLITFQEKSQRESTEFAAISNLLKTRHDSEMQAVNNMKS